MVVIGATSHQSILSVRLYILPDLGVGLTALIQPVQ